MRPGEAAMKIPSSGFRLHLLKLAASLLLALVAGAVNVAVLNFGFGIAPVNWGVIVFGYLAIGILGTALHAVDSWAGDRLQRLRDENSTNAAARRFYAVQPSQEH